MRDQLTVMDQGKLRRFLPRVLGDQTFSESLRRSRRILNITVSPLRKQQVPRLLNYLSAPQALVNSAVLASCAVPVAFKPVQLIARRRGRVEPWMKNELWIDGSVHRDLPFDSLRQMLNINQFITSQTNPHVVPLLTLYATRRASRPRSHARGGNIYQHGSAELLDILRKHVPGSRLRSQLDKAHAVYNQNYASTDMHIQMPSGRSCTQDAEQPVAGGFHSYTRMGELATWPRMDDDPRPHPPVTHVRQCHRRADDADRCPRRETRLAITAWRNWRVRWRRWLLSVRGGDWVGSRACLCPSLPLMKSLIKVK